MDRDRTIDARFRRFAIGVIAASGIAGIATRHHALTPGGALAAAIVGGAVYLGAGPRGSAALVAFFTSSTLLGRLPASRAPAQRRGNRRDAVQVLANGGLSAALALAAEAASPTLRPRILAALAGAVAAATADTWATEIGTRFGLSPRSIVTLRPLPPGTSGGVTAAGLVASACGAALISLLLAAGRRTRSSRSLSDRALASRIALAGVVGSLADSVLGATIQDLRYCDQCRAPTELPIHSCGTPTRHLRGAPWCTNDVVNAIAIGIGAAMAGLALPRVNSPGATTTVAHEPRDDSSHVASSQRASRLGHSRLALRGRSRVEFVPRTRLLPRLGSTPSSALNWAHAKTGRGSPRRAPARSRTAGRQSP